MQCTNTHIISRTETDTFSGKRSITTFAAFCIHSTPNTSCTAC